MLEIKRDKNTHGYDFFHIITDEGTFEISFQNNLDLYFRYIPKTRLSSGTPEVSITKENYYIYTLFEELYNSIQNINLYPETTIDNTIIKNHQTLFKNDIIEWYSDDFALIENASSFIIEKNEEIFKLIFKKSKQEPESGMYFETYSVRISNSGSRYKPFNSNFMKMYQDLKEYDPDYHQIHIEEYLYEQKKLSKIIKGIN